MHSTSQQHGRAVKQPARHIVGAVVTIAICLAIGGLGGALTATSVDTWYATLIKPPWNPPNAVFGPVWTTLYVMMALSYWLVWRRAGLGGARRATALFALQLLLNLGWSALFFGLRRVDLALVEMIALALAIGLTAHAFKRHSLWAAILMLPYLAWVSYALSLNAAIWWLNR